MSDKMPESFFRLQVFLATYMAVTAVEVGPAV
jgi:hypothetical protein